MKKVLLQVFGLVPAALLLAYASVVAILSLLAFPSGPLISVIAVAGLSITIWGSLTVIFVILGKPIQHRRYGLYAALVGPGLMALKGLSGVTTLLDLAITLAAIGLFSITVYLIRADSGANSETAEG